MPIYEVENYKIHLTRIQDRFLLDKLNILPWERIGRHVRPVGSTFSGGVNPDKEKCDTLFTEYLTSEFKKDEDGFIDNWVKFDIKEDLGYETPELILDYLAINEAGFLRSANDFIHELDNPNEIDIDLALNNELKDKNAITDKSYPPGLLVESTILHNRKYVLNLFYKQDHKTKFKQLINNNEQSVCIFIDAKKVTRIKGTLNYFIVMTQYYNIYFGEGIRVMPKDTLEPE